MLTLQQVNERMYKSNPATLESISRTKILFPKFGTEMDWQYMAIQIAVDKE